MKNGEHIKIRFKGTDWMDAEIELASDNGRSLAVLVDEGVPIPFGVKGNKQCVMLLKQDDGTWLDILAGRPVQVQRV